MAINVSSGFWNNSYSFIDGRSPIERGIARKMNKRGMRDVRALMDALLGAAAGGAASASYKRITHPTDSDNLGGLRTVETIDLVNRVTTVGDDTTITSRVLSFSSQPSYPTNADRNPRKLNGG